MYNINLLKLSGDLLVNKQGAINIRSTFRGVGNDTNELYSLSA